MRPENADAYRPRQRLSVTRLRRLASRSRLVQLHQFILTRTVRRENVRDPGPTVCGGINCGDQWHTLALRDCRKYLIIFYLWLSLQKCQIRN
jgi:hypothetical protein